MSLTLQSYLERSVREGSKHAAVEEADGRALSFAELGALSDRLRDRLRRLGVEPGDRVGLHLHKSADSVATLYGILKAGAAYVPVDPDAPAQRNGFIFDDCDVRVVVVEASAADALRASLAEHGATPAMLVLDGVGAGAPLAAALDAADADDPAPTCETLHPDGDSLAYILYTSGSTGNPKGVMISQAAATAFVEWCVTAHEPTADDRFSSHAPFHFDLSVHDLYVSARQGATLVLIDEELGKEPQRLAETIAARAISVWYSTPSVLRLLVQFGRLEQHDLARVRVVIFAGEVFPVKHLRALQDALPHARYLNWYGPTETNVCTAYELPGRVLDERTEPLPIGAACPHYRAVVLDADGKAVSAGRPGELCMAGTAVMTGYWNLPERNAGAFVEVFGQPFYRTGDVVVENDEGEFTYVSRLDRMVKRRGYRVELGEIESALYRHPAIAEAGVVSLPDEEAGVGIHAFLATTSGEKLSLIALKRFCKQTLPSYMIPDRFHIVDALPKTSTDKVDYQRLKAAL